MTSSDANCLTAVALVLDFVGFDVNYENCGLCNFVGKLQTLKLSLFFFSKFSVISLICFFKYGSRAVIKVSTVGAWGSSESPMALSTHRALKAVQKCAHVSFCPSGRLLVSHKLDLEVSRSGISIYFLRLYRICL